MSTETSTSPITTRRQASVAARKQRILEAARVLLAQSGPEGLSMRKLAREADLSVTTLYNLIGSREEILQALIDDSLERLEVSIPDALTIRDPLRRAAAALDSMLQYMIDNAAVLRPLIVADFSTGYNETLARHDEGEHFKKFKSAIIESVTAATESGSLRSVVGSRFLEEQLYVGLGLALDRWAFGLLDDERFRLKSLGGFYLAMLAFAETDARPALERELRRIERKLKPKA